MTPEEYMNFPHVICTHDIVGRISYCYIRAFAAPSVAVKHFAAHKFTVDASQEEKDDVEAVEGRVEEKR
ncbi:hypothetical protein QTP88_024148 [Uroleucon formosanum]